MSLRCRTFSETTGCVHSARRRKRWEVSFAVAVLEDASFVAVPRSATTATAAAAAAAAAGGGGGGGGGGGRGGSSGSSIISSNISSHSNSNISCGADNSSSGSIIVRAVEASLSVAHIVLPLIWIHTWKFKWPGDPTLQTHRVAIHLTSWMSQPSYLDVGSRVSVNTVICCSRSITLKGTSRDSLRLNNFARNTVVKGSTSV